MDWLKSLLRSWLTSAYFDLAFRGLRAVAIAWLVLFALLGTFQRRLLYVPVGDMATPAQASLIGVTQIYLDTHDGERLVAWTAPATPGQPTFLMFHGNSGTLSHRAHYFKAYMSAGWGFYAMSYRSFSGNGGRPTEADNIADALAAYDAVRASGVVARDIYLFGESLGSGVAVQVAAQRSVAGMVLDSPYSSIADVASQLYWYLPVRLALLDRYDSTAHIKRVSAPVLILHGEQDSIIPIRFARRLADAATSAVTFRAYPDTGHVQPLFRGGLADVQTWLGTVRR